MLVEYYKMVITFYARFVFAFYLLYCEHSLVSLNIPQLCLFSVVYHYLNTKEYLSYSCVWERVGHSHGRYVVGLLNRYCSHFQHFQVAFRKFCVYSAEERMPSPAMNGTILQMWGKCKTSVFFIMRSFSFTRLFPELLPCARECVSSSARVRHSAILRKFAVA